MADVGPRSHGLVDIAWVVATTAGLAVGGFMFHFPGSFGGLSGWDVTAVIFGGLLGFISGLAVGLIQWAALLLGRSDGLRLLLWMGLGIGVTHAFNDGAPSAMGLLAVAFVSGLAMAAAYAWSLGERRPIPIVTVGVAWVAGLMAASWVAYWAVPRIGLPSLVEAMPTAWATTHAIEGLVVGVIWGSATALVGVPERLRLTTTHERPTPVEVDPA